MVLPNTEIIILRNDRGQQTEQGVCLPSLQSQHVRLGQPIKLLREVAYHIVLRAAAGKNHSKIQGARNDAEHRTSLITPATLQRHYGTSLHFTSACKSVNQ